MTNPSSTLERSLLPEFISRLRETLVGQASMASAEFVQDVTRHHKAVSTSQLSAIQDSVVATPSLIDEALHLERPDSIAIYYVTAATMEVLKHVESQMSPDDLEHVINDVCAQPHFTDKPVLVLSEQALPYSMLQGRALGDMDLPFSLGPETAPATPERAHGVLIPHLTPEQNVLQAYIISSQAQIRRMTRHQRKYKLLALVATLLHFQAQGQLITSRDESLQLAQLPSSTSQSAKNPAPMSPVRFLDLRSVRTASSEELERAQEQQRRYGVSHRFIVSGHLRRQPYGPNRSQTRLIYIEPYIKGADGTPLIIRPDIKIV